MRKAIIFSFVCLAAALSFVSCDIVFENEDHAVNQLITYYPDYDITGGSTLAWQIGTPWVDPGYSAVFKGKDITSELEITSNLNTNEAGIYNIDYGYTNDDGFYNKVTRTVVVYDIANAATTDISGKYANNTIIDLPDTEDEYNYKARCQYEMTIAKGPGTGLFYIQDLFCGLWAQYSKYGDDYEFYAMVQLNTDNTISILTISCIWPYAMEPYGTSYYDPNDGSITINWFWGGWGDTLRSIYKKK